jgi:putative transcriptional regulator
MFVQGGSKMAFSTDIKNARLSCLMNQVEFGDAIGVSYTTINRWENGKAKPNLKAMKSLKSFCAENGLSYELIEASWLELKNQA